MTPACAGLLEVRGSGLGLLKSTLNAKNSYAGFLGLYWVLGLYLTISAQFTLKMCVAARNQDKFTKTPNFRVSRLFKVIDVDKTKKPVTSACSDKQHVCTRSYLQPFSR